MDMKKSAAKRSCSRGNKRGSVIVKGHKNSKGKSISCHRRRKPVRSHMKKSHKKSQKK